MRNLFLSIAILLISPVWAQNVKITNLKPGEKTKRFMTYWTKELTLTEDQQAKANPIILGMFTKMSELKSDTTMERKTKMKSMRDTHKAGSDAFRALLTTDQANLYDKKVEEMKNKRGSKPDGKQKGDKKGVKKAAKDEIESEDIF